MFLLVFVCGFAVFSVAFILFSFVFIFGQKLSPNSKDTDVTTASVELNIRTIITSLLLTLEIVHTGTNSPINFYGVVFNSSIIIIDPS